MQRFFMHYGDSNIRRNESLPLFCLLGDELIINLRQDESCILKHISTNAFSMGTSLGRLKHSISRKGDIQFHNMKVNT